MPPASFEMDWTQRSSGVQGVIPCLLVRDAEHNLAVAQDLDEDTGPLDLKLAPGLTLQVGWNATANRSRRRPPR